jgi:hypothetical protein
VNRWSTIRDEYLAWVRTFPMLREMGRPGSSAELQAAAAEGREEEPVYQDVAFWSARTHEAEARGRRHLSEAEIDAVFDEVAAAVDADLRRFDPLIAYFARFFDEGDAQRIEDEREVAHGVKRDLAWAAVEMAIGLGHVIARETASGGEHASDLVKSTAEAAGFFVSLLPVYDRGRWPCGWAGGVYPVGHLLYL